jgi:hypothetical protein
VCGAAGTTTTTLSLLIVVVYTSKFDFSVSMFVNLVGRSVPSVGARLLALPGRCQLWSVDFLDAFLPVNTRAQSVLLHVRDVRGDALQLWQQDGVVGADVGLVQGAVVARTALRVVVAHALSELLEFDLQLVAPAIHVIITSLRAEHFLLLAQDLRLTLLLIQGGLRDQGSPWGLLIHRVDVNQPITVSE